MKTHKNEIRERHLFLQSWCLLKQLFVIALIMPSLLLIASGQTMSAKQAGSTGAAQQSRNDIVPLVDYHVHLLGPYALPMPDPMPPEVKLPAELDRILAERGKLVGNVGTESDFKNIFTEDAQLLNASQAKRQS